MTIYIWSTSGTKYDISDATSGSGTDTNTLVWDTANPNTYFPYNGYILTNMYYTWTTVTPDTLIQHCCVQHIKQSRPYVENEPGIGGPILMNQYEHDCTAIFSSPHPEYKYNASYGYTYMTFEAINAAGQTSDTISIELSELAPWFTGPLSHTPPSYYTTAVRDVKFGGVKKGTVNIHLRELHAMYANNGGMYAHIGADMSQDLLANHDIVGTRIGISMRCINSI